MGLIAVLLIGWFLGIDVTPLLQDQGTSGPSSAPTELTAEDRAAGEFVSVVLADTEEIWARVFKDQLGRDYRPATLVLFKEGTRSACGGATEATGPFWRPIKYSLFPPLGLNLFLSSSRFGEPLPRLYRYVVPFLITLGIGVLLITYMPWMTTGLLRLLGKL